MYENGLVMVGFNLLKSFKKSLTSRLFLSVVLIRKCAGKQHKMKKGAFVYLKGISQQWASKAAAFEC